MTERVQIIVEAKDAATGILRGITSQFGAIGNVIEDVASPTKNWGNLTASATEAVVNALKDAIETTQQYGEDVRNLSQISGQSAEASSRFIQVLDDYQLSAQDALTATRMLTKNGYAPTIETLATLSDQYNKLGTAQQKNDFIIKNLGRSGLQWVNLLKQGGDALRAQGAAVSSSLILNDQQVAKLEELRLAQDNLNDSVEGLKISIGTELVPVLADAIGILNGDIQATLGLGDAMRQAAADADQYSAANDKVAVYLRDIADWAAAIVNSTLPSFMRDEGAAANEAAGGVDNLSGALEDNVKAQQEAEKAASQARQAMLTSMFSLESASESYASGEESRAKRLEDIKAEEVRLALELSKIRAEELAAIKEENKEYAYSAGLEGLQDKQHKGKLTRIEKRIEAMKDQHAEMEHEAKLTDITNGYLEDQASITAQILKLQEQEKELATESEQAKTEQAKATNQLVYNMLQQKAAQDGIVSSDELAFLMEQAVKMDLVSAASANAAISASKTADTMWASFEKTAAPDSPMSKTKDLMYDMVDLDGYVVNFKVNFSTEGALLPPDFTGFPEPTEKPYYPPTNKNRAEGGMVYAGETYWVGERGIPELYTPKRDGFITPGNKVGGITININGGLITQETVDYLSQEITKVQTG